MSTSEIDIDVFVIGAMKSATTGMCGWLARQPGLAMSEPKEPSIFSSDDSVQRWAPRIDQLYSGVGPSALRVDGSTDYAKFPHVTGVPERVRRHCPEARIVYMMRHPVTRAMSQYQFEWFLGGDRKPFEKAIGANRQLIDNGRYAFQLEQWLNWFPADRFLLVFAEAFALDPAAEVSRVLDFLGLSGAEVVAPEHERSNETALLVRRSLARRILRHSTFGEAIRPLVPSVVTAAYRNRLQVRSKARLSAPVRRQLEEDFDTDLAGLGPRIGRPDLSCATWDDIATSIKPVLQFP